MSTAVLASTLPDLTSELQIAIVADFADIEAANGYLGIAHKHGVSMAQVGDLHTYALSLVNVPLDDES